MAKVTYNAPTGEPATQTQFGIEWTAGQVVDVSSPAVLARVRLSDHYDVVEDGDDEPANEGGLQAEHRGGGRFVIKHGEGEDDVIKGLSKADADAFNALSDADKAAYVEAHKAPAE